MLLHPAFRMLKGWCISPASLLYPPEKVRYVPSCAVAGPADQGRDATPAKARFQADFSMPSCNLWHECWMITKLRFGDIYLKLLSSFEGV
jgi:hypothetical protein